jgi:Forkhead domain
MLLALFDFGRARTGPQTMAGSGGLSDEASGADGTRGIIVPPSHFDFDSSDDMASLVDSARLAGSWGARPFQSPWVQSMGADGEWTAITGLANPVLDLTQFQQYVDPVLVSPVCYQERPDAMVVDERLPISTLAASPFDFGGSPQSYLTPPLSPSGFARERTPVGFVGTVQESDLHINAAVDTSLMSPASTSHYSEPYHPLEPEGGAAAQQGASKGSDQPYAQLLYQCLSEAEGHQMALRDIYDWFRRNTDKCANEELRGWQNSIRHNLSMNQVRSLPSPYSFD